MFKVFDCLTADPVYVIYSVRFELVCYTQLQNKKCLVICQYILILQLIFRHITRRHHQGVSHQDSKHEGLQQTTIAVFIVLHYNCS